jgi:hypothetical protein
VLIQARFCVFDLSLSIPQKKRNLGGGGNGRSAPQISLDSHVSAVVQFDFVVLLTVVAHNHPRYRQPQRPHPIHTLIPEPSADTIHNPVLPQAHWLIIIRLDLLLPEPRLHNPGKEFLTVNAAQMLLYPMVLPIAATSAALV